MADFNLVVGTKVDTSDIQAQLDKMPKKATVTTKVKFDGKDAIKDVTTYTDKLGNMAVVTKLTTENGEQLSNNLTKVKTTTNDASTSLDKASKSAKSVGDNFNHSSRQGKTLSSQFIDITKKVIAFGTATQVIMLFRQGISEAITVVKEFDSAVTEFSKVSDYSREQIDNYAKSMDGMAESVARTRTEFLGASTEFKRSGFTEEQSAQLAKIAGLYQNISDSQLTAGESSSFVISQMKAFNITANDAISIIDKVNEVSNNFSVSSSDISSALTKTSGAMATYGNTIDEAIGLTVAGTEILTGQAGKVSRGLRSVGAELVKLANDSGEFTYKVNGTTKALSLFDEQGKMLSTFDALEKIYQDWDKMNEAEQSSLALTLGMKTQIDVLSAVFNNFDSAINATNTSMNSQGSAMEENAKYMQSLEARISLLRAEFTKFVLGDGGLSNLLKMLVDTGTAILKFANSDIGQVIIKTTALVGALALLNKGTILLSSSFIKAGTNAFFAQKGVTALTLSQMGATAGTVSFTTALKALTVAWAISPFGIATIAVGAILTIVKLIDTFTVSTKEATEALNKSSQEYNTATSNIKSLEAELESVNGKIKEINSQGGAKTAREGELTTLQAQSVELERQLSIQKALAEEARKSAEESAKKLLTTQDTNISYLPTGEVVYDSETQVQQLQGITDSIKALNDEKKKLDESYDSGAISASEYKSQTADLNKEISDLTSEGATLSNTLNEAVNNLTSTDGSTVSLKKNIVKIIDEFLKFIPVSDEVSDKLKDVKDSLDESGEAAGENADKVKDIDEKYQDSINSLSDLDSAYNLITGAVDEYNSANGMSTSTILKLLSLGDEYLALLSFENGQLSLNKNAMMELINARIEEAKAVIAEKAEIKIAQIDHIRFNNTLNDGVSAANSAGSALITAGNNAITSAKKALSAASGWQTLWNAVRNGANIIGKITGSGDPTSAYNVERRKAEVEMQVRAEQAKMDKMLKEAENSMNKALTSGGGGSGGGGGRKGGGGGGGKSAEQLAKEATQAYKEQYDIQRKELDHKLAMDIIKEEEYYETLNQLNQQYFGEASGHHDEFLDEYRKNEEEYYKWQKKQKEKELETYKMATDAIKKTLEDQLDDLKEERDEELEYLDERIDKIEEKKDAELDSIKVTIDALKEEEKAFKKNIESQIDALEELQNKEEEEWDAKIEAFKEQNKVLEDQIELQRLQENLAKAKSTKVKIFQNGKFVYGTDESAVSSAEEAIQDYYDRRKQEEELEALEDARDSALENYQKQIDDLKKYKDSMSENYEKRLEGLDSYYDSVEEKFDLEIEQLQKHREEVEAEYDEQIEDMEDYIQDFEDMIDEYENEQNKLALIQLEGTKAESENWANRLNNLRDFVDEYKSLQKELNEDHIEKEPSSSSGGSSSNKPSGSASDSKPNKPSGPASDPDLIGRRATGDSSIKEDGMYFIGDNPNAELTIGSKLNHDSGVLSYLKSGTGVVNAKSTNTLAGLLNNLGSLSSPVLNSNANNSMSVQIGSISLPQVTNGEEFVDYLKGFSTRMIQNSY